MLPIGVRGVSHGPAIEGSTEGTRPPPGPAHQEVTKSKHAIVALFLLGSLALAATTVAQTADSAVTPDRTIALWNGKDLSNWVADVPKRDADPSLPDSFVVRGGMLVSLGKPEGHLITKQAYRDYRLVAEYRFPGAGGNRGILIHASTPRALYKMFPRSIEASG